MNISSTIKSSLNQHDVTVQTNGDEKTMMIQTKPSGYGSSINGGELLMLSLATCFCNDIYREAIKRKMRVHSVVVECTGEFGGEGEPGSNFKYTAHVNAEASREEIEDLIEYTDKIAEIHNTLRKGIEITLVK
jgi:uncharacterized OsmC-like protein